MQPGQRVHGRENLAGSWLEASSGRTFKLSNDKQFVEKLEDVVGLYLNPPENAIVLSCDDRCRPWTARNPGYL